jgi:hypothetical protein
MKTTLTDITRFCLGGNDTMEPDEQGRWVEYDDVADLLAERHALAALLREARHGIALAYEVFDCQQGDVRLNAITLRIDAALAALPMAPVLPLIGMAMEQVR